MHIPNFLVLWASGRWTKEYENNITIENKTDFEIMYFKFYKLIPLRN